MSTLIPQLEFDYPESDGKPMGETDWHIDAIIRLRDMLRRRYSGQRVYVGSDLLVYYVEGEPRQFVVPDVFVVLDCDPRERATFKIWEEHRIPDVVFEITSRSTAREDQVFKPKTYGQMGVKEMFLFDPGGDLLKPRLQGHRFLSDVPIAMATQEGQLHSAVLGIDLEVREKRLSLSDSATGDKLLTGEESEREARIAVQARADRLEAELEQLRKQLRNK